MFDVLDVFYVLDIVQRAIELMLPVYRHTDENKDYLSISIYLLMTTGQHLHCYLLL